MNSKRPSWLNRISFQQNGKSRRRLAIRDSTRQYSSARHRAIANYQGVRSANKSSNNLLLVCCLISADLLNCATTGVCSALTLLYLTNNAADVEVYHPCVHLLLDAVLHAAYNASLLTLCIIAYDLCSGLLWPITYNRWKANSPVGLCIILLWLISLLFGSTQIMLPAITQQLTSNYVKNHTDLRDDVTVTSNVDSFCISQWDLNLIRSSYFTTGILILAVGFITLAHTTASCFIRSRTNRFNNSSLPNLQRSPNQVNCCQFSHYKKGICMIFLLLTLFLITFIPFIVLEMMFLGIVTQMLPTESSELLAKPAMNTLKLFAVNLPLINPCVNPLLYAFRLPEVKQAMLQLKFRFSDCFEMTREEEQNQSPVPLRQSHDRRSRRRTIISRAPFHQDEQTVYSVERDFCQSTSHVTLSTLFTNKYENCHVLPFNSDANRLLSTQSLKYATAFEKNSYTDKIHRNTV